MNLFWIWTISTFMTTTTAQSLCGYIMHYDDYYNEYKPFAMDVCSSSSGPISKSSRKFICDSNGKAWQYYYQYYTGCTDTGPTITEYTGEYYCGSDDVSLCQIAWLQRSPVTSSCVMVNTEKTENIPIIINECLYSNVSNTYNYWYCGKGSSNIITYVYHKSTTDISLCTHSGGSLRYGGNTCQPSVAKYDWSSCPGPPTPKPTNNPTQYTINPTQYPTDNPSAFTINPTNNPTTTPSKMPSNNPSVYPTTYPSNNPSISPTKYPTISPTENPTTSPTPSPTVRPTDSPTRDIQDIIGNNSDSKGVFSMSVIYICYVVTVLCILCF